MTKTQSLWSLVACLGPSLLVAAAATPKVPAAAAPEVASCPPGPGQRSVQVQKDGDPNSIVWPWQQYHTSDLTPPNLDITTNGGSLGPGYYFLAPTGNGTKQSGLYIFTSDNDLVYGANVFNATNVRVQQYQGQPYLTYWTASNGKGITIGYGYGQVSFVDSNYTQAYTLCPALGLNTGMSPPPACQADAHEQQMTTRNTMLVSAYSRKAADLTRFGGRADGIFLDSLFFEMDPATNKVLFSWRASDHVPLEQSHEPFPSLATPHPPWDYFHINSVAQVGSNYLVNSRHTWSTYLVSGDDGHIIWTFNGETGGDFGSLPANGHFRWQHHARPHDVGPDGMTLSIFNNYNAEGDYGTNLTDGLLYRLPLQASSPAGQTTLLRRVERPADPLFTSSRGSYHPALPPNAGDGVSNQLMGYGDVPVFREYGPQPAGGDLRLQARFGNGNAVQSYRVFKQAWHATPKAWDPALVLAPGTDAGCSTAYASWNGATDVTGWAVYEGAAAGSLARVASVVKRGFETSFGVPGRGCVQVGALRNGAEVRRSSVQCH